MSVAAISIKQGEDAVITLTGGSTEDLSDYTLAMQIRRTPDSTTAVFSVSDTDYLDGSTGGDVAVTVTAAASAAVPAGKLVYDIFGTSTGGETTRLYEGPVYVSPRVTR